MMVNNSLRWFLSIAPPSFSAHKNHVIRPIGVRAFREHGIVRSLLLLTLETFYLSGILSNFYLKPLLSGTENCTVNRWNDARYKYQYRHKWRITGQSYLLSEHGDLSLLLQFYIETDIGKGNLRKVLKSCLITFFVRNHLKVGERLLDALQIV